MTKILQEARADGIFTRTVTAEQARQAAKNLIDAHFGNKNGNGVSINIPARPYDDDILLTDFIKQQSAAITAAEQRAYDRAVDALEQDACPRGNQ